MSPEDRAAAIRQHRDNPTFRALLQLLEDESVQQQGTTHLATTVQAGISAYHNGGAAAVNNVIDQVAATLEDT